jgi:hypothetical protein
MEEKTITGQIYTKALQLLDKYPEGIHWSELISKVRKAYPTFHPKTINGCIWKLVEKFPDQVYKPEKGLFRLIKYKSV